MRLESVAELSNKITKKKQFAEMQTEQLDSITSKIYQNGKKTTVGRKCFYKSVETKIILSVFHSKL